MAQEQAFQPGSQFMHADGGLYTSWIPQAGYTPAAAGQEFAETDPRKNDKNRHNDRYKTRMCHYILRGKPCPQGFSCSFAHSEVEMRIRKPFKQQVSQDDTGEGQQPSTSSGARFKTRLCVHWVKSSGKWCPLGTRCRFAHGEVRVCAKSYDRLAQFCGLQGELRASNHSERSAEGTQAHVPHSQHVARNQYFSAIPQGYGHQPFPSQMGQAQFTPHTSAPAQPMLLGSVYAQQGQDSSMHSQSSQGLQDAAGLAETVKPIAHSTNTTSTMDLPDGFAPLELSDSTAPLSQFELSDPSSAQSFHDEHASHFHSPWPHSETAHTYTGSSQLAATLQSLGIQIADGEHVQLEAMLADMHISATADLAT